MSQTEQSTRVSGVVPQVAPPVLMMRGKPVRLWLALAAVIIGYFMGTSGR